MIRALPAAGLSAHTAQALATRPVSAAIPNAEKCNNSNMQFNFLLPDIQTIASQIITEASPQKIFLFYGEMGAGKTTLIKSLCEVLGVEGSVTSPTFAIVNEYAGKAGPVFHFDFYRLKNQTEALDMGYEEYFYSGDYCFIEWPEKIPDLLPPNYTEVRIVAGNDGSRSITLTNI
jgi:tRNA threonylcarbamoyladenosine biosynthesis protein TsaE